MMFFRRPTPLRQSHRQRVRQITRRRSRAHRRRSRAETLEDRRLLATVIVDTLNDVVDENDAVISLREALAIADSADEATRIEFDPAVIPATDAILQLASGPLNTSADQPLEIVGPGSDSLEIIATAGARVLTATSADLAIEGLTFRGGRTSVNNGPGGGAFISSTGSVMLRDMAFRDNATAGNQSPGGALYVVADQTTVLDSVFAGNGTTGAGSRGGGIAVEGSLTIRRSSMIENETTSTHANGGGVSIENGNLAMINTTVSGNRTAVNPGSLAGSGGGNVHLGAAANNGLHRILSSTIVGGTSNFGGGIGLTSNDTLQLVHTIVASNMTGTSDMPGEPSVPDEGTDIGYPTNIFAREVNARFSFVGFGEGGGLRESTTPDENGNLIGGVQNGPLDPQLLELDLYDGPRPIHRPADNSPVINAGNNALALDPMNQPIVNDGRGAPFNRISQTIDIGAFEVFLRTTPTITWPTPENILVGTPLSATQLNATTNVAGSFVYTPAAGTFLGEGTFTLTADFTPDDLETFEPTQAQVSLRVLQPSDFGDAPDSYLTRSASGGPIHTGSSLRLGTTASFEADANVNLGVDADTDSGDDGVTFETSIVASPTVPTLASIRVNVSSTAKLDAWIDFDGNGSFDAGEHLFGGTSSDVFTGDNRVVVTVPAGATAGTSYARFRLSTAGDLAPGGDAVDGEVEDYRINIVDATSASDLFVDVPGNRLALRSEAGNVVFSRSDVDVFRVPQEAIDLLSVFADDGSGTFTVVPASQSGVLPTGGFAFDGRGGINTLRIDGPLDDLPLTDQDQMVLTNVDVIDLLSGTTTAVAVSAATLERIDGDGAGLIINGGDEETISVDVPEDFRMGDPIDIAGELFNVLTTDASLLQFNFGPGWHNAANPGDINNDGSVTPRDALNVLNELRRVSYHDEETSVLFSPILVDPFPGFWFDQDANNRITPLDALRVLNEVRRNQSGGGSGGEGEYTAAGGLIIDDLDDDKDDRRRKRFID
ncbi:MAG: GEVED domain-containing protein [Planctomycetota bacterium]